MVPTSEAHGPSWVGPLAVGNPMDSLGNSSHNFRFPCLITQKGQMPAMTTGHNASSVLTAVRKRR